MPSDKKKKEPTSSGEQLPLIEAAEPAPDLKSKVTLTVEKAVAPGPVPPPDPLVSFSRWFKSRRFKPHWAAGMQAFTDTSRRRSIADWDVLFKNY